MKKLLFILSGMLVTGLMAYATDTVIVGIGPTSTPVTISDGGTGATTATGARSNLGLGNLATMNNITGNVGNLIYGEMYETGTPGNLYNLTSAATYYQWTTMTNDEASGTGYLTYDGTNKRLVVGADGGGKYRINFDINGLADYQGVYTFGLFKNNSQITKSNVYRALGKTGEMFPTAVSVVYGTYSYGDLTSILYEDQQLTNASNTAKYVYAVSELGTNTGFIVQFDFTAAERANRLIIKGNYNGHSADDVVTQIRDWSITPTVILGTDSNTYTCIRGHTAAAANRPVTGADWASYWKLTGTGGVTWSSDASYVSGWTAITANVRDMPQTTNSIFTTHEYPIVWSSNYLNGSRNLSVRIIHSSAGGVAADAQLIDQLYLVREHPMFTASKEIITSLVAGDYIDLRMSNTVAGTNVEIRSLNLTMERINR